MLRIRNLDCKPRLIGHGYHVSSRGKKYVRILRMNYMYFVQVKLLPHKDLHVLWRTAHPYKFIGSFLELQIYADNICPCDINQRIEDKLNAVWFE